MLDDLHPELAVLGAQPAQRLREDRQQRGLEDGQPHGAAHLGKAAMELGLGPLQPGQQFVGGVHEGLRGGGELQGSAHFAQ